ncbi:MAG: LysE family translocator [Pseudomonadota bacterium]
MAWELALLYLAWLIGGASPGPATLALASTGMARGRRAALGLALGVLVGSAFWGVLAALGFGAVMLSAGWVAEALRYAGAGYILWLAFKSLRSAAKPGAPDYAAAAPAAPMRAFRRGVALHITNPKAIFSWAAIFAVGVAPGAGAAEVIAFGLFMYTGSIVVFIGYAHLFSIEGAMRRYAAGRRWFEAAFGVLFGAAALAILRTKPS